MPSIYEEAKAAAEIDAVEAAVIGVPPDHRIVAECRNDPEAISALAIEIQRGLFALNCEFFQVVFEPTTGRIVGDGWYDRHVIKAKYTPPGLEKKSGFAMELNPKDRAKLRKIVVKTHRMYLGEDPNMRVVDSLIDGLGPSVAQNLLKQAIDAGQI